MKIPFHKSQFDSYHKRKRKIKIYNQNCHKDQKHVHELTGSTKIFNECNDCHNHRFCTVTGEAIYHKEKDKYDHYHEVKFHTDFSDEHFHEFCGKTTGAIDVGNGKHVHFIKDFTEEEDNHKHELQAATLIDSPIDYKCK